MDFGTNKTPIEIIKEGAFRDIYSGINNKWYKNSWKEFDVLWDINQKYYCSDYYDVSLNKYSVKCGDFGKIKDGLIKLTLMDDFNGVLDIG